jgi:tRNA1(Val) A37 N6-methylase TrmN6
MNHKLSSQAIGAIMMALQKSLIEQSDITDVLKGFEIQVDDSGQLVVMNPPTFEIPKEEQRDA